MSQTSSMVTLAMRRLLEREMPAVEAWFAEGPVEWRSIAQTWFVQMRQCGDDVRELLHDGSPVACVADAPLGYGNSFKRHVNIGFFYGAALEDPAGLLEGGGLRMRHVKSTPGRAIKAAAIRDLVDAAYLDMQAAPRCLVMRHRELISTEKIT